VLRYFNVAGATPDGVLGESHEPETHLIPRILAAASTQQEVGIFGTDYPTPDGTCIRDYVHVDDLIDAHLLALERLTPSKGAVYNLGSEKGFSVREVIKAAEKVVGHPIRIREMPRRAGDPAILVASSAKIKTELGWKCSHPSIEAMISHAWAWQPKRFIRLK
jgi:UDP-glucose 4-epimerase